MALLHAAVLAAHDLEAVLAHEFTHIRNRDAQLMVVAVIFAGIIAFFSDMAVRMWNFPYGWSPTPRRQRSPAGWTTGDDVDGLLATHPPIAARIEALRRYAGAEQESAVAAPRRGGAASAR